MKFLITFLIILFLCPLVLAEGFNPQNYYFNFKVGDKDINYDDRVSMYYHYLDSQKWKESIEETDLNVWR